MCTYNGAARIGETLRHLAQQEKVTVPWEVIVVDNASNDGTAEVALREWPYDASAPLRIFHERSPGYNHAADLGIAKSRYGIIAHVHDDVWLDTDWLARAAAIFTSNPAIGACGGYNRANCECSPPAWFKRYEEYFAVGQQADSSGDITFSRGYLWGAGLCIRASAWRDLKGSGFAPLTTGRNASCKLIAGEDSEVCYALRLAGWKLWYSDELRLTHFIRRERLTWRYLCRLSRSFGEASALHDCYLYPITRNRIRANLWSKAVLRSLVDLWRSRLGFLALLTGAEGNLHAVRLERRIGRAAELIRMRKSYKATHHRVLNANWRGQRRASHDLSALPSGIASNNLHSSPS